MTSDLENGDAPNAQQCPLSEWKIPLEDPLTEPNSSNNAFSPSIPAPTPAQRMKTSNTLEWPVSRNSDDLMAQQSVSRKIPRPTSPEPHDHTDPIRILAPNSDTSSQSQSIQSQLRRLSPHVQAGSAIDYGSKALLLGIIVDLQRGEYPFLNLMRVREILERTYRLR